MQQETRRLGISARMIAWLAIGLGWSLAFWLVVWPELLLCAVAIGLVNGAVTWLWLRYVAWRDRPRARVVDAAERTWRRFS